MAQDYSEYLAIHVLNEQQAVSYRSLSRALKVHVNLAKQMLYEFHRKQNAKKPHAVHATYLLSGTRAEQTPSQAVNATHSQDDGDTVMQSSPPIPGSSPPRATEDEETPMKVRSILLVREEHLDKAKATFEKITSIHVYSLQTGGVGDIQTLTECNRSIAAAYASEDPLLVSKQYGTIQDPNVRRRTQKRAPPVAAAPPPPKPAPAQAKPAPAATKPTAPEKQTSKTTDASDSTKATPEPQASTAAPRKGAAARVPTNKRQNSDIFKSFAKGANKPKKTPDSSAAPSPAPPPADDEPMGGMSDDEPGDAANDEEVEAREVAGKLRKDRQAELEAMMDADDDEDEPMEEPVESAPESQEQGESQPTESEEPKETLTVENGRRRGRRRIMKKKTVKDEEGYLVTREEAAWESFSEDEPAPKKAKIAPAAPAAKGTAKKGTNPGQGNIMSFFGKK